MDLISQAGSLGPGPRAQVPYQFDIPGRGRLPGPGLQDPGSQAGNINLIFQIGVQDPGSQKSSARTQGPGLKPQTPDPRPQASGPDHSSQAF